MDLDFLFNYVKSDTGYDLMKKTRKREFVYARALFCILAKENTKSSLEVIGEKIGKDHATVKHAIEKTFPEAMINEKWIQNSYKKLSIDVVAEVVDSVNDEWVDVEDSKYLKFVHNIADLKSTCSRLYKEKLELINKLEESSIGRGMDERFTLLVNSLAPEQLDIFYVRMEAAAKMLKSHKTYDTV